MTHDNNFEVAWRRDQMPWDHAYVAGPDNICQTCGWIGSYVHTKVFYQRYGPRFELRTETATSIEQRESPE